MPSPYTMPAPNGPAACPRCLAPVIWTLTSARRVPMMVDRDRDPQGNAAVRQDVSGRWVSRQLSTDRPTPEAGEHLHRPHVANCPAPRGAGRPGRRSAASRYRSTRTPASQRTPL